MQEVVCADCGAINRLVAQSCWRCLEPLSDTAGTAAVAPAAEPAPQPRTATA